MPTYNSLVPVEKRILLHLLNCHNYSRKFEVPTALSQEGIADAVGTNKSYISSSIKKIIADGLVREGVGRVKRGKKKRKYFLLTNQGKDYTQKLKKELLCRQITVKHQDGGLKTMELKDIVPYLKHEKICPDIMDLDVYKIASKEGTLDIENLKNIMKIQFLDFTGEAPRIVYFFGREGELIRLEKWMEDREGNNLIFIHGMAGIGKTTLATKLIESFRGSKHLFWHGVHSLDTLRGLLFKLSEFLSRLGYDHLEIYLRTRTSLDYSEISRILRKSIGYIDAILIFDDFHKSNETIREFFVYFLGMLGSSSKTKLLILSREIVPFYDRRDVLAKKTVAELELEGLDYDSTKRLLKEKGIDKRMFKEIYGLTAGNPLFLELIESKDHLERYVHDELFLKLKEDEKIILGLISIYRFPVQQDTLATNDDFDFEKLYVLTSKSIVKKDAQDRYFVSFR